MWEEYPGSWAALAMRKCETSNLFKNSINLFQKLQQRDENGPISTPSMQLL